MRVALMLIIFCSVPILANELDDEEILICMESQQKQLQEFSANHHHHHSPRMSTSNSQSIPNNVPIPSVNIPPLEQGLSRSGHYNQTDEKNLKFNANRAASYEYFKKIGKGGFSKVYIGKRQNDSHPVVLKHLRSPKWKSVNREIQILTHLFNSSKHIVNLIDAVKDFKNDTALLVYDYVNSMSLVELVPKLRLQDLKFYMYQLAKAIEHSHKKGVMHRDVKLTNTILDKNKKHLILIDWGLSSFYKSGTRYSCRVGTRFYKAPELLLGNQYYDYAVDMWSYGAVLARLLFKKHPIFQGKEDPEVLISILKILGTDDMWAYLDKYDLEIPNRLKKISGVKPWETFRNRQNSYLLNEDGLDLISKLLVYDHVLLLSHNQKKIRLTASETLNHEFFDSVRDIY